MNLYETLLIVTPEADDDGVNAVIGDLRTAIESDGGTVLQAGIWQRRQLAYAVQGKTEGIYVLIYADGPVTLPAVVKDRLRLDEAVIRNMVVRVEDPQETEVRATIAEQEVNAGEADAQRLAAERRAVAAAETAAMSAAEAEAAAEEASAAEAEAAADEASEAAPEEASEAGAEEASEAEAEEATEEAAAEEGAEAEAADDGEVSDEGADAAEEAAPDTAEAAETAADEPAEALNDDAAGDAGDQGDEDTTEEEEKKES